MLVHESSVWPVVFGEESRVLVLESSVRPVMSGERVECWCMRAVSGQLCLEREQSVGT